MQEKDQPYEMMRANFVAVSLKTLAVLVLPVRAIGGSTGYSDWSDSAEHRSRQPRR